jgi:hypothetical protein
MQAEGEGDDTGDLSSMTIPQIKVWLTDNGHEAAVWALNSNRTAKKADWVQLMREKM